MNSKGHMDSGILERTTQNVCAMTYMHNSVANLHRVGAGATLPFSDARSNECCETVVILGNGAASPVWTDRLLLACFSFALSLLLACFQLAPMFAFRLFLTCFQFVSGLLVACFQLACTFTLNLL